LFSTNTISRLVDPSVSIPSISSKVLTSARAREDFIGGGNFRVTTNAMMIYLQSAGDRARVADVAFGRLLGFASKYVLVRS